MKTEDLISPFHLTQEQHGAIRLPPPRLSQHEIMRRMHNAIQAYTMRHTIDEIDQQLVRDWIDIKGDVYGWSDE